MNRNAIVTCAIMAALGVIAVIALLGWMGWRHYHDVQHSMHQEESRERELIREVQLGLVANVLDEAAEAAAAGDTDEPVQLLRQAGDQLAIISSAAAQAGDTAAAADFEALRRLTGDAISTIESAPEGDQRVEAAHAVISGLRDAFGKYAAFGTVPEE